jgi:hypothetical protein
MVLIRASLFSLWPSVLCSFQAEVKFSERAYICRSERVVRGGFAERMYRDINDAESGERESAFRMWWVLEGLMRMSLRRVTARCS